MVWRNVSRGGRARQRGAGQSAPPQSVGPRSPASPRDGAPRRQVSLYHRLQRRTQPAERRRQRRAQLPERRSSRWSQHLRPRESRRRFSQALEMTPEAPRGGFAHNLLSIAVRPPPVVPLGATALQPSARSPTPLGAPLRDLALRAARACATVQSAVSR